MKTLIASLLVVISISLTTALSAAEKKAKAKDDSAPKSVSWKISGDLEEACSCSAACPCWFDSKPTQKTCGGTEFLFIKKGNYGKVKLDGLAVGGFSQSPEGKGMMESFGDWEFSYLYIDDKATPEQRDALKQIAMMVLPANASKKTEIRFAPITQKIDGKDHEITVGNYGSFRGHVIEGGLGGPAKITNPPGADPLHHEYEQGLNSKLAYTDADQNWNHSGTNYMFGKFTVDSEQYKKFATGLAQKMAGMSKDKEKGDEKK
jgi:hypothetical protein